MSEATGRPGRRGTKVAGVDGWRGGWVIAVLDIADRTISLRSEADFAAVIATTRDCAVVGVDIPLSLPTGSERASDAALRSHLGKRSSSLFATPCRQAIACDDYSAANAMNRTVTGKGLSKQSWGLAAKIRDARVATGHLVPEAGIYEVHPESSFVELCGHDELVNKKTARGVGQRLSALETELGQLAAVLAGGPPGPGLDDGLDAIAAAWTAGRVATGDASWFGPDGYDDEGFATAVPV